MTDTLVSEFTQKLTEVVRAQVLQEIRGMTVEELMALHWIAEGVEPEPKPEAPKKAAAGKKASSSNLLSRVVETVRGTGGVSAEKLANALSVKKPALAAALSEGVQTGALTKSGRARGTKYHAASASKTASAMAAKSDGPLERIVAYILDRNKRLWGDDEGAYVMTTSKVLLQAGIGANLADTRRLLNEAIAKGLILRRKSWYGTSYDLPYDHEADDESNQVVAWMKSRNYIIRQDGLKEDTRFTLQQIAKSKVWASPNDASVNEKYVLEFIKAGIDEGLISSTGSGPRQKYFLIE